MAPETVKDGLVISLEYTLKLDDGEVIDEATSDDPLLYLHGNDNIIPGLEAALTGMALNESKSVEVKPEDAYGEYDEEGIEEMERDFFPEDVKIELGEMLSLSDEEDNIYDAIIVEIDDDLITLDFNHPLAGQTLFFEVKVVGIREATAEELEHGHPHVPGMHEH